MERSDPYKTRTREFAIAGYADPDIKVDRGLDLRPWPA